VVKQVLEATANQDYREAGETLETCGCTLSAAKVGALVQEQGEKLRQELFGPEAALKAAKQAPANPPDFLILCADGSRYRTNEADQRKERARAAPSEPRTKSSSPTGQEDKGWRENKMGLVIRAERGRIEADGNYTPPRELHKTYVATTGDIQEFGGYLRTEFERRGGVDCPEVVCPTDHGHGLPEMWGREFPQARVVTDFWHVSQRLAECAEAICGAGEAKAKARERFYQRWKKLLWDGEVQRLAASLKKLAGKRAPEPTSLTELDAQPETQKLWTHALYLQKHQDTMRYPEYRARGWPISSSTVESACGQFGQRLKHNRMRWTRRSADALHHIKAAIYSHDERWAKRWPAPIPILDLPLTG
jgi:hypothetical protein